MTTLSVPSNVIGVELPNGQKLDANKQGKIHIDDPRVERQAMKSSAASMGIVSRTAYSFDTPSTETRVCVGCSFRGWPWQDTCPKCNDSMTSLEEAE